MCARACMCVCVPRCVCVCVCVCACVGVSVVAFSHDYTVVVQQTKQSISHSSAPPPPPPPFPSRQQRNKHTTARPVLNPDSYQETARQVSHPRRSVYLWCSFSTEQTAHNQRPETVSHSLENRQYETQSVKLDGRTEQKKKKKKKEKNLCRASHYVSERGHHDPAPH